MTTAAPTSEIADEAREDLIIPSPFDPRLILRIAPAVALAAMRTGVALRPIEDMAAYAEGLDRFVFRSGFVMRPIFAAARADPRRVPARWRRRPGSRHRRCCVPAGSSWAGCR